jgi:hypothetical protein
MSNERPFVYDKAKYHDQSVQEHDLPDNHAYHHTTYFLAWLIRNRLMSEWFETEAKDEIAKYRAGDISVNDLYEWWDCCLISDMLNDEGNAFAQAYFDFDKGRYIADYEQHLLGDLPSIFHLPYTTEYEAMIHRVVDDRYREWKAENDA